MRRLIGRLITTIGLGLVGLGKKLDPPEPASPVKEIRLNRRYYRIVGASPSRWEVIRIGLGILFSSVTFAAIGV